MNTRSSRGEFEFYEIHMNYFLYVIISSFLVVCCEDVDHIYYTENNSVEYSTGGILNWTGIKALSLDSTINPSSSFSYIDYFDGSEVPVVTIISPSAQAIIEFDYLTGEIIKRIALATQGPFVVHPIGSNNGILKVNQDNFLYVNHASATVYFLDDHARPLKSFNLQDIVKSPAGIFATNWHLISSNGRSCYLSCYPFKGNLPYSDKYASLKFNLEDTSLVPHTKMPPIFDRAYWGTHPCMYIPSFEFHRSTLVGSFAVDPFIHNYVGAGTKKSQTFIGSEYFTTIEPQSSDTHRNSVLESSSSPESRKYFSSLNFYFGIKYDKYRDVFYRLVRLGKNDSNDVVEWSIIVMDEKYRKLAEKKLPDDIYPQLAFVSKDGLLFYRYN